MKEHLTLAWFASQSKNIDFRAAIDRLRQAVGIEVKTVESHEPLESLSRGEADLALVDTATAVVSIRHGITIAAILSRRPVRERVLALADVLRPSLENPFGIPNGARVGVSSPRHIGPLLRCCDVDVSVTGEGHDQALQHLEEGALHALIVSESYCRDSYTGSGRFEQIDLPEEVLLPAPGSGTFVLATSVGNPCIKSVTGLNEPATERCVYAELELLRILGPAASTLGCLARETADGAIRLAACLSCNSADQRTAEVLRVASVSPDPVNAARGCAAAIQEIQPDQNDILPA